MTSPTREQIEATIALPTYTVEVDFGLGYEEVNGAHVISLNTVLETSNNIDNAFAFGSIAIIHASFETADDVLTANWEFRKVRIRYGFDDSDKITAFEGILTKRQRSGRTFSFECSGFDYLIERTKIYTDVFYRRPIATKTTATSVENVVADNYRAGLLNYVMWMSGGRPYEQYADYNSDVDRKFWYSFDESILKPRWAWLSGENAWEEIYKLVRAAGGQFYQDVDGVFYYKQPLSFGYVEEGATLYHFTEDTYATMQEDASTIDMMDTVVCSYVDRVVQPMQQIYESTSPQLIPDGETTEIEIEMQHPIYQYETTLNDIDIMTEGAIKATYLDGRDATTDAIDWSITVTSRSAQRVVLTIENNSGEPISLNKIILHGRPITAGSEGIVRYTGV